MWYIFYHNFNKINYACIEYEIKFEIIFILNKNIQDINEICDSLNKWSNGNIYYNKTLMFEDVFL